MAEWAAGPVGALCAGVCMSWGRCSRAQLYVAYYVLHVCCCMFTSHIYGYVYIYMGGSDRMPPRGAAWTPGTIRGQISGRMFVGGVSLGFRA